MVSDTLTRDIIRDWHAALAAGDVDRVLALSADDIRIRGPRGDAVGHTALRQWAKRSGIKLSPIAWHPIPSGYIVEAEARWSTSVSDGDPSILGEPALQVATVFEVSDGRVRQVARFDTLDQAKRSLGSSGDDHRD